MSTQMNAAMKVTSYMAYTSLIDYMARKPESAAVICKKDKSEVTIDDMRGAAQLKLADAVKAFGYMYDITCLDFDKVLACMIRRLKGDLVLSDIAAFRKILREFNKVIYATVKYKEAAMPRVSDKPKKVSKTQRKKEIYQKLDYLKQQADTGEIDLKTYMQAQSELLEELREL